MKKIIYGITCLCLMFVGVINVHAATDEHIKITPATSKLEIIEGANALFEIVVDDAIVRANITSNDTNVVKINAALYGKVEGSDLQENGKWVSAGGIYDRTLAHPIPVTAVGEAGDTTTITVDVYDATVYGGGETSKISPLTYTIEVTIVEADESAVTEYTITYDANDGKDAPAAQTKKAGEDLNLAIAKPTKEGHKFMGWNTQKDGKGKSYEAGGKYTEDENVTLYAMWKAEGNVKDNPNTGDTMIYVVLLLTLGALIYSYWYMKKSQEN